MASAVLVLIAASEGHESLVSFSWSLVWPFVVIMIWDVFVGRMHAKEEDDEYRET